ASCSCDTGFGFLLALMTRNASPISNTTPITSILLKSSADDKLGLDRAKLLIAGAPTNITTMTAIRQCFTRRILSLLHSALGESTGNPKSPATRLAKGVCVHGYN